MHYLVDNLQPENSYRTILKRIAAFGGVHALSALIALVRGKLVAMLLGSTGMGITSLFSSSTGFIQQIAGLGLNQALVKEVAPIKGDADKMKVLMSAALRLILLTSLGGGAICFLLSPLLSLWTFGSADYTAGFMFMSICVALTIASVAYTGLLQGVGAVKYLVKASVVGGLAGLCFGVPLYYFFGYNGIVPSLTVGALTMFTFYYTSFRKSGYNLAVKFNWAEHKPLVMRLLKVGTVLMIGSMITSFVGYVVNVYVKTHGSLSDVGLYNAANSLTNQYVGLVFSALAMDYFPRLSAALNKPGEFNAIINRQIEIMSLIIAPMVICLIATAPWIIRLLLTDEFLPVTSLMRWMGLGIMILAITYPLSYVFIVKNDSRIYLIMEVIMPAVLWILTSFLFYHLWGLVGLGVSFVVRMFVGDSIAYVVLHRIYGVTVSRSNLLRIIFTAIVCSSAFVASLFDNCHWSVFAAILSVSLLFSGISLYRRTKKAQN